MVGNNQSRARLGRYLAFAVGFLITCIVLHLYLVSQLQPLVFDHVIGRTCQPFLCLFTTFRPGIYKIPVCITRGIMISDHYSMLLLYNYNVWISV